MSEKGIDVQQVRQAICDPGPESNCSECCAIFTDDELRTAFGYQAEAAACQCHDICVEDVRDICAAARTLRTCIPCNVNGGAGCRGGFQANGVPTVLNWRVLCAGESLSPETGCDRIINDIEFEVVLTYGTNTLVVLTPREIFNCPWYEFARFPSGVFYEESSEGLDAFRQELSLIDGSCKVIIVDDVRVVTVNSNCVLEIDYRVIDKLWKHENLLISAIRPYPGVDERENITVSETFEQGHAIRPCTGNNLCPLIPPINGG